MRAIAQAEQDGLSVERGCEVMGLPRRRLYRWRDRVEASPDDPPCALEEQRRGPERAPHRLLEEEKVAIVTGADEAPFAGLSAPKMAAMFAREDRVHVSGSSVERVLKEAGQTGVRRPRSRKKPLKPEASVTGPNQVWGFDLTYVRVALVWMYVIFILDLYSRKIVGWRFTSEATAREVQRAFEVALGAENLLEPGRHVPTMISDRGSQMKAKSLRQFFRDLGAAHLFSRPHVPTDNAIAETTIGCFKLEGPGGDCFPDPLTADHEIAVWVAYYNQGRLHGGIGYVTPEEEHSGQGEARREARRRALREARARRLETHRAQKDLVERAA